MVVLIGFEQHWYGLNCSSFFKLKFTMVSSSLLVLLMWVDVLNSLFNFKIVCYVCVTRIKDPDKS